MIEIEIYEKNSRYSIRARGHADYAPLGQDIVCASVSVLLQSLGNYISEHALEYNWRVLECKYEKGDICIDTLEELPLPGTHLKDLYHMVEDSLIDIANQYPAFLKIISKLTPERVEM